MPQSMGLQRVGRDLVTEYFRIFYVGEHAICGEKKRVILLLSFQFGSAQVNTLQIVF